jgi:hypothetical protein
MQVGQSKRTTEQISKYADPPLLRPASGWPGLRLYRGAGGNGDLQGALYTAAAIGDQDEVVPRHNSVRLRNQQLRAAAWQASLLPLLPCLAYFGSGAEP